MEPNETNELSSEKKRSRRERDLRFTFRVNEQEHALIMRRMEQSGIKNMRAYLLKMAVDGKIVHIHLDSVNEMVRLLSNATNNVNQIARRVNATGNLNAVDVEDLRARYDELWAQAREILRKLNSL